MIKLQCFVESNSEVKLYAKRAVSIAFGAGSSCAESDGWNGGIAISFYDNIGTYGSTDVQIGCGGDVGVANAGMSRFLNTIATGGGIKKRGSVIITASGEEPVYDNGVGAMGNWLSTGDYNRANLQSDAEEYIKSVWPELVESEEWTSLFETLKSQSLSQTGSGTIVQYDMAGDIQPGAYGVNSTTNGACGAVFVFMEYEDA